MQDPEAKQFYEVKNTAAEIKPKVSRLNVGCWFHSIQFTVFHPSQLTGFGCLATCLPSLKVIILENVLGIAAVMDEVLSELEQALPNYEMCHRILDPFLASNFIWALFDMITCNHNSSWNLFLLETQV